MITSTEHFTTDHTTDLSQLEKQIYLRIMQNPTSTSQRDPWRNIGLLVLLDFASLRTSPVDRDFSTSLPRLQLIFSCCKTFNYAISISQISLKKRPGIASSVMVICALWWQQSQSQQWPCTNATSDAHSHCCCYDYIPPLDVWFHNSLSFCDCISKYYL